MSIHEKTVTRYEVVCDECGAHLGEFSIREDARESERWHRSARHVEPAAAGAGRTSARPR